MKTTQTTVLAVCTVILAGCGESTSNVAAPSPIAAPTALTEPNEAESAPTSGSERGASEPNGTVEPNRTGTALPLSGPFVTSISPARVLSRCEAQTLTIRGGGFRPGLIVHLVEPTGRRSALGAPQVWNVTANSFQMALYTGPGAGLWRLQPTNPDGGASLPVALFVDGVYAPAPPFARSMTPTRVRANGALQTITVSGGNFQRGVFATYTAPNGQRIAVGSGQVVYVSATSLRVSLNFGARAGIGHLYFTNPDCGQSGLPLSFLVD